ncbi:MAG TPA: PTS sugar transporter subunit IIC [Candidatus Blautia excrementipullorum]|nr:PTS sugar transporter subunit IIC [Candidatus Mediterraneibacter norwichensis]HJB17212.1 PTS sugar transporter subunit IIC [Candidatus Blautia excrementipullorum]HJD46903.1 PTS sugar transporter subunit IIC [Candidatus Mediterraneibacter norfolkensis]
MYEAMIVGLILGALWFIEKFFGTCMVIRPLVVSPLVGLALGDLQTGVIIGATLELVFMGAIQIGGAVPPDALVGAGLGTAFAILTGQGAEIALTLALPIAILAQSVKVLLFIVRSGFMTPAIKYAQEGNIRKMKMLNYAGLILQSLMYFSVAFVAIMFGSAAVEAFVNNIPESIMQGLNVAAGLLPAVGFALLLLPMMNLKNVIYFVVGFILVSYLELPIMAVTILGILLAFIVAYEKGSFKPQSVNAAQEGEEDLFDE